MSFAHPADYIANAPYTDPTFVLALVVMGQSADPETGILWPSVTKLAKSCRLSKRRFQVILTQLIEDGFVERHQRVRVNDRNETNVYRMYLTAEAAERKKARREGRQIQDSTPAIPEIPDRGGCRGQHPVGVVDSTQGGCRGQHPLGVVGDIQKNSKKEYSFVEEEKRASAPAPLIQKIIEAANLPPQSANTLRILTRNYPQFTPEEWAFHAAAAAEWFAEHDRRMTARNLGPWIEREARRRRELDARDAATQEVSHVQPAASPAPVRGTSRDARRDPQRHTAAQSVQSVNDFWNGPEGRAWVESALHQPSEGAGLRLAGSLSGGDGSQGRRDSRADPRPSPSPLGA